MSNRAVSAIPYNKIIRKATLILFYFYTFKVIDNNNFDLL